MIPAPWQLDPNTPPHATGRSVASSVTYNQFRNHLDLTLHEVDGEWLGARINTRAALTFQHGSASFRVKLPHVRGAWAAVWTMGDPWPAAQEFDLVETGMPASKWAQQTAHDERGQDIINRVPHDGEWHTWRLDRKAGWAWWYLDGQRLGGCADEHMPHWLCLDLMAWGEKPPEKSAKLSLSNFTLTSFQ